jgi:uncharacterized DUF497 family protein
VHILTEWGTSGILPSARANAAKDCVHFGDDVAALGDERAVTIRDSWSDQEERWITLGQEGLGRVLVVVYSWRDENVRLISARLATH